jgi:hypothetical protein
MIGCARISTPTFHIFSTSPYFYIIVAGFWGVEKKKETMEMIRK